jgi:hypothetical protein
MISAALQVGLKRALLVMVTCDPSAHDQRSAAGGGARHSGIARVTRCLWEGRGRDGHTLCHSLAHRLSPLPARTPPLTPARLSHRRAWLPRRPCPPTPGPRSTRGSCGASPTRSVAMRPYAIHVNQACHASPRKAARVDQHTVEQTAPAARRFAAPGVAPGCWQRAARRLPQPLHDPYRSARTRRVLVQSARGQGVC